MNKRYIAGRAAEYRAKKELEKEGWVVLRASGSHGVFDLAAAHPTYSKTRWIQIKTCKNNSMSRMREDFLGHPPLMGSFDRSQELWVWHCGTWYKSVT